VLFALFAAHFAMLAWAWRRPGLVKPAADL